MVTAYFAPLEIRCTQRTHSEHTLEHFLPTVILMGCYSMHKEPEQTPCKFCEKNKTKQKKTGWMLFPLFGYSSPYMGAAHGPRGMQGI